MNRCVCKPGKPCVYHQLHPVTESADSLRDRLKQNIEWRDQAQTGFDTAQDQARAAFHNLSRAQEAVERSECDLRVAEMDG